MSHRVTLIPGTGSDPRSSTPRDERWRRRASDPVGARPRSRRDGRSGEVLPAATLASIRENGVALKGPIETPATAGVGNANVALRKELDLYANVRPCRRYPGVPSVYEEVDLVVVREDTEDVYTGIELEVGTPDVKELIAFIEETTDVRIRDDSGISVKAISHRGASGSSGSRSRRPDRAGGGRSPPGTRRTS